MTGIDVVHWLKKYGGLLLLAVVLLVLVLSFGGVARVALQFRSVVAFALAAAALFFVNAKTFPSAAEEAARRASGVTDAGSGGYVKYFIAFHAAVFTVGGLAVVISAVNRWELGILIAGACLLIGGFIGLLFGYPQGAATQPAAPGKATDNPQLAPPVKTNLVAESALTLGKVLTGFTLAKLGSLGGHFWDLCGKIAPALGTPLGSPNADAVLCAAIVVYFLATGFLSGLLLPSYFMTGKWG